MTTMKKNTTTTTMTKILDQMFNTGCPQGIPRNNTNETGTQQNGSSVFSLETICLYSRTEWLSVFQRNTIKIDKRSFPASTFAQVQVRILDVYHLRMMHYLVSDTSILGKINPPSCRSQQESNLRHPD